VEIPINDFNTNKVTFRLYNEENEAAIKLGFGELKPLTFSLPQCPYFFVTKFNGKKTAKIYLSGEWESK